MIKIKFFAIIIAIIFVLPSFFALAAPQENTSANAYLQGEGQTASKDEVVYAVLNSLGELTEIYVVNILDVLSPGVITDYGNYTTVKNLTDLSEIELNGNEVRLTTEKGKFYYQGNMIDQELPWDFIVTYFLNGRKTAPEDLVGKNGRLEIQINIRANENLNSIFNEYYILQITLPLNSNVFTNIEAEDAIVANVGKNMQANYAVLPEQDADLKLKADVVDFEMEGIEIAAIPYFMAFDADLDEMTSNLQPLADAIQEVNNGVGKLKNGISQLNDGLQGLSNGSLQFKEGMDGIDEASSQIIGGSSTFKNGLNNITNSMSEDLNIGQWNQSKLESLPEKLSILSEKLSEVAAELDFMGSIYTDAYSRLDHAMAEIPDYTIAEEEIQELYSSDADNAVIDKLLETYRASVTARETYNTVSDDIDIADNILTEIRSCLLALSYSIDLVSKELPSLLEIMEVAASFAEFEEEFSALAYHYEEFHSGLVNYTKGINILTNSYGEIHSGIVGISNGANELEKGVGELEKGTDKLAQSTRTMPEEMKKEIDKMISQFDKSDFDPVSFTAPENTKISLVQFVIKTENIKIDKTENIIVEDDKAEGFWARLLHLFSQIRL